MSLDDFALKLELDTAGDGTWSQDETARLYSWTLDRGRQDALGRMVPGRLIAVMNNRDGRWSEEQTVVSGLGDYVPVRLFVDWTEPAVTNLDDGPAEHNSAAWTNIASGNAGVISNDNWTGKRECTGIDSFGVGDGAAKQKFDGSGRFAVSPSTVYSWKMRLKGNPAGKNWQLAIAWYTSADVFISQTPVSVIGLPFDWTGAFVTGTSPSNAAKAQLNIKCISTGVNSIRVDASMFYQGSVALPYVDGRQPGCSWAGTADASQSSRSANPSFLLFQGFLLDVSGADDKKNQTATITCGDFLEILKDRELNMGAMGFKLADVLLDRILDRLEGELISNYGNEDMTALTTNNYRNWTPLAPSGGGSLEIGVWANTDNMNNDFGETFEGDWWAGFNTAGNAAGEGLRYNLAADLTVAGKYRISIRYRLKPGQASQLFDFEVRRDGAVIASVQKLVTAGAWAKQDFGEVDFTTLGTTREIDVKTVGGAVRTIRLDAVHCVLETAVIPRDLRAGTETDIQPIVAYNEPAGPFFDDVVDSEPGQLFVKAKDKATGGEVTFHDDDWRQVVEVVPRCVLGDGDGLMQFAPGLLWRHDGRDRVNRVIVTSRGSQVEGARVNSLWQLAPVRDIVNGEDFRAHYSQFAMACIQLQKVGTYNKEMVNFGVGCNMRPTSTTSQSYVAIQGVSIDPPTERSQVEAEDTTLSFVRPLTVALPLQQSNSAQMDTIASRLLAKFKLAVARYTVPLNAQALDNGDEDLIYATQFALDLDERILIRAAFQSHSPQPSGSSGVECFIEGIRHSQARKQLIHTALIVEQV